MERPDKPKLSLSRPRDRSLEAYREREWIGKTLESLGIPPERREVDEERLRQSWERFWRKTAEEPER